MVALNSLRNVIQLFNEGKEMLNTKIEKRSVLLSATRNNIILRTMAIVYFVDMLHSRDQKKAGARKRENANAIKPGLK